MTKFSRLFLFVAVLALTAAAPAWCQETALTGTVTDPTGALVTGATVTVTNEATGVVRTVKTGDDGRYLVSQLEPGTYKIEIKMQGFKTSQTAKVAVPVGLTSRFDVALTLGDVSETVIVEAETTRINTVDASIGTPFSGQQVLNLPSLNLDPAGLLSLQAGVTYVPGAPDAPGGYSGTNDFDSRGGSVNGARSDQSNITLDGVDVNDQINGFAFTSVLRATQASLQEFRVTTTNYNAEQGRSSAAQVQLVTRPGTNDVHGTAYWAHRNEVFNANDFFANRDGVDRGKFRRHIYGAALGGPVVKDRFFLFGNWEELRENLATSIIRQIPSNSLRDGVLIYECTNGAGPDGIPGTADDPPPCPTAATTVQGISGAMYNVPSGFYGLRPSELAAIDPLGIGPSAAALTEFQNFPNPNAVGSFDGFNIVGFNFNTPTDNFFRTWILRADYFLDKNASHAIFWRGTMHDDNFTVAGPQFPGELTNQTKVNGNRGFSLGYKAVLSPNMVNNFRWGLTRVSEQTAGLQQSSFVNFRFIDNLTFNEVNNATFGRVLPIHHFRDDFSWAMGKHTWSFGGEMRFMRNSKFSNAASFHAFSMNPSWLPNVGRNVQPGDIQGNCVQVGCDAVPAVASTGEDAYRDVVINLLGIISQATAQYNFDRTGATLPQGDPVPRRFAVNEYEAYVQDQWRLFPSLTITYGARYQVSSVPWETNGNQVNPTPGLNQWFETRRQLMLAGIGSNHAPQLTFALGGPVNNGPGYYEKDWNNWSPRVAAAWQPNFKSGPLHWLLGEGKTAIRGGYGLVYDRIGAGLVNTFDNVGSFGMSTGIDSTFGGCDEGGGVAPVACPRFTTVFDTAPATFMLPPSPGGTFPAAPPGADPFGIPLPGSFAITSAIDNGVQTPYAHAYNFSISREFGSGFSIEAAYVGRSGRKGLILRDMAMPADVCDPASGACYFGAAQQLLALGEQGAPLASVAAIPYWENLFPSWGPSGINGGQLVCDIQGVDPGFAGGFSASQVAYDFINCVHPDTTVFPWIIDTFGGFPGWMRGSPGDQDIDGDGIPDAPFAFFDDQFSSLNAWSSIARSEYHALQLTVRKRLGWGIQFDANYTLSKSLDMSSSAERAGALTGFSGTGGYTGSTINSWQPDLEYSFSDYDMRHQFNANWIAELPFGRGRHFGSGAAGWVDHIFGGWQLSGIVRANSGIPANVINARVWPTNWDLQGNATCQPATGNRFGTQVGPCPTTQNVHGAIHSNVPGSAPVPNLFGSPDMAFDKFRFTLPGQRGERNILRADYYVNFDFALAKTFRMPWESHKLQLRWEVFNVLNQVFFDATSLSASIGRASTFGDYSAMLGRPRQMQVGLRYEF